MHALNAHDDRRVLLLDEAAARRLLLAQAVDTADPQGRLVGLEERERIEREALAATGDPAAGRPLDATGWLRARADALVALLAHRQPRLAALAEPPPWRRWLAWGLPLLALVLGGVLDRIDNPRQVNLLSPPLLAFLLWNVAVYLVLLVVALRPRRPPRPPGPLAAWALGLAQRRTHGARADVAKAFALQWWNAAAGLEGQRWRRILHTSAATWAVGVAVSIALGGLVREYRVGWESTLLDLPQVHAFLRVLFAPVVALLPLEPFTQAELARLHFGSGVDVGRLEARRWVGLYIALLGIVVVAPRALLALWAAWRQSRLQRAIAVDLEAPYFTALVGRVSPARVRLALAAGEPRDLATLVRVLSQAGDAPAGAPGQGWTVLATPRDDALEALEVAPAAIAAAEAPAAPGRRLWPRAAPRATGVAGWQPDAVLLACRDAREVEAVAPGLRRLDVPLLLVAAAGTEAGHAQALRAAGLRGEVLALEALPTWREDGRLLAALARLLPAWKAPGMERLATLWRERASVRLAEAMRLLAGEIAQSVRDAQPLPVTPMGVRHLVVRGEREAGAEARREAVGAVLARVRERQAATDKRLLAAYRLDGSSHALIEHALPERFHVHHAVHAPQAGLAGAASGAAMGATVDLMTGGLTLGAASALGALVGGGAALAAAAWKNRAAEPGASLVVLDDAMLLALVQVAVLRYLGVVHAGRAGEQGSDAWPQAVDAALRPHHAALHALFQRARADRDEGPLVAQLAALLQEVTLAVLASLHGDDRPREQA